MSNAKFHVLGIGNAIVDVLSFCDDAFLLEEGLLRGGMTLVDAPRSSALYARKGQATECSGGSVANSLAGLASLGAKCAFIGKVAADQLGTIFTHDMRAVGVHYDTQPISNDISTAVCLVFVTQDAQRTMATYLGACTQLAEDDIDPALVAASAITYVEGYLWHGEEAKAAIRKAIELAKESGRKVAFTLSDAFCVEHYREEFLELIKHRIDILFANETEIKALFRTDDFDAAVKNIRGLCPIAAVTRSEKGSLVVTKEAVEKVAAERVARVIDTTGAGDLFASGFLYGLTHGKSLAACAQLGNRCAGEIIAQLGARSLRPLNRLVA